MDTSAKRLSVVEKVGYSLGDLAAQSHLPDLHHLPRLFYTDVFKIRAGTASTIILWGGIIGGVHFNPIMGLIADRPETR